MNITVLRSSRRGGLLRGGTPCGEREVPFGKLVMQEWRWFCSMYVPRM